MEGPSPARLYATLLGAIMLLTGIGGFFYSASFGQPGKVAELLGIIAVNGWVNAVYIATGALGLATAGFAARQFAFCIGALYVAIAIWGFSIGTGDSILGLLPVNSGGNFFQLIVGLLGITAALATPARRLKTRTNPAS